MKISKYEFDSQEAAELKIAALPHSTDEDGNSHPSHKHTIVKLGHIVLEQGEYDEEGNETQAPVLSDKYSVDVLWMPPFKFTKLKGGTEIERWHQTESESLEGIRVV